MCVIYTQNCAEDTVELNGIKTQTITVTEQALNSERSEASERLFGVQKMTVIL